MLLVFCPHRVRAQAEPDCVRDVVVRAGDTLGRIASRYLGDPTVYERIVAATDAAAALDGSYASITNPNNLQIGWKLCIPPEPARRAAPEPRSLTRSGTETLAISPTISPTIDVSTLTIDYLRRQEYPASEVEILEEFEPGDGYRRYLAAYRSEGLRVQALLTVPDGAKPATGWPVIVFNHGYIPPLVYRSDERYEEYVDALARGGYIVFRPDYRGHGFSDGEARGVYGYPDYTVDVLNAVSAIKEYPDADSERIGLWGHSMGGFITLRAMVTRADIRAGVIWAGVVAPYEDLTQHWNLRATNVPSQARRWRDELLTRFGTPAENPGPWRALSANSYFAELSGPVQLHHGTLDEVVPFEFSNKAYKQMTLDGQQVEYYTYPGDDHNISRSFDKAMARTLAFFDRYLKGDGQRSDD